LTTLVIDTATNLEIIAACSGNKSAEASGFVDTSHSITILDNVDRCLKKLKITIGDIDIIGVGIGPGSFTGIRIAVSTGRMLAQILEKPLVGIKTQLLYAVSVKALEGDNILIAFDAKKNRVFGALYRKSDDTLRPHEIIPPGDYSIQELIESIDTSRTTHMAGSGIDKYGAIINPAVENKTILHEFFPGGKIMCDLVFNSYRDDPGKYIDYNRVTPFYARKSDAEAAKGIIKPD
jgi:tRNA threonylcarbamoyladenosine biosynthesis protein TsaB